MNETIADKGYRDGYFGEYAKSVILHTLDEFQRREYEFNYWIGKQDHYDDRD